MGIKKGREAFESVFTETRGWDLTFIMGCYQNIETLRAFAGWQAAKAQAVPEGFVLVPKEPTQKMLNAGHVVMNPIKGSLVQAGTNQKRRDCYKAMIEAAQEQANESE